MSTTKVAELRVYGTEPSWENKTFKDELDRDCALIKALNWYNYMSSDKDREEWVLTYLKNNNYDKSIINNIKNNKKYTINYGEMSKFPYGFDVAVYCRLIELKAPLPQFRLDDVVASIDYLTKIPTKLIDKDDNLKDALVAKKNIQQNISANASNIIADISQNIDLLLKSKSKINLDMPNVKPIYCSKIIENFEPQLKEFETVLSKTDSDLNEAYSNYDENNVINTKTFLSSLIDYCKNIIQKYKSEKVIIRRKRRKSPIDMVKKLKFMKEFKELNLTSISAPKIIESQKLAVYNTKSRVFTIFESDSANGLSIKGSTVLFFDNKKSKSKKIRKPEEFFKNIKDKGIRAVKNSFDSVKCKESTPTGRINEDCILYGVY